MFKKIASVFVLSFLVIISCQKIQEQREGITIKGTYAEKDAQFFVAFFKQMQKAVETENIEDSIKFYSKDFMSDEGASLSKLRENTEYIYKNYKDISYKMFNIRITVKDNKAVSIDEFEYKATPVNKEFKPLSYTGTERIYWQKESDTWKIINWVAE